MKDTCICKGGKCTKEKLAKTCISFGAVFFVVGVVLSVGFSAVMDYMTVKLSKMSKGSEIGEIWKSSKADGKIFAYIWHVENSKEILRNPKTKVRLQEKGPYVYRLKLGYTDVEWSEDDLSISYQRLPSLTFLPEESNGTEQDYAVAINVPVVTMGHMLRGFQGWTGFFVKQTVETMLNAYPDNQVFMNATVKDYLFGYDSALHRMFNSNELAQFMMSEEGIPENGVLSRLNNTTDGLFRMYTGVDDINKRGLIQTFKNQSSLKIWNSKFANMINGSDGVFNPPFVKPDAKLYYFMPHLYRSLPLMMTQHSNVRGIPAYRFSETLDVFNYSLPENRDFCTPSSSNCPYNGLLNISEPNLGAPVMISRPHFTGGDPAIFERFTGLHPDPGLISFFDIHPRLGISMGGQQAVQLNVQVTPTQGFKGLGMWPETVFPFMWFKQTFQMSDDQAAKIKPLTTMERLIPPLQYLMISLGLVMIITGTCVLCWRRRLKRQRYKVYDQQLRVLTVGKGGNSEDLITPPDKSQLTTFPEGMNGVKSTHMCNGHAEHIGYTDLTFIQQDNIDKIKNENYVGRKSQNTGNLYFSSAEDINNNNNNNKRISGSEEPLLLNEIRNCTVPFHPTLDQPELNFQTFQALKESVI